MAVNCYSDTAFAQNKRGACFDSNSAKKYWKATYFLYVQFMFKLLNIVWVFESILNTNDIQRAYNDSIQPMDIMWAVLCKQYNRRYYSLLQRKWMFCFGKHTHSATPTTFWDVQPVQSNQMVLYILTCKLFYVSQPKTCTSCSVTINWC